MMITACASRTCDCEMLCHNGMQSRCHHFFSRSVWRLYEWASLPVNGYPYLVTQVVQLYIQEWGAFWRCNRRCVRSARISRAGDNNTGPDRKEATLHVWPSSNPAPASPFSV